MIESVGIVAKPGQDDCPALLERLLARLAVQAGLWTVVPVAFLTVFACGTACLTFAINGTFHCRFGTYISAVGFVSWILTSVAITWFGVLLIEMLPFTIGDGP